MNTRSFFSRLPVLAFALLAMVPAVAAQTPTPLAPQPPRPFQFRTDPVLAVASYYNAIAVGDYGRAYAYWENGPLNSTTLEGFAAGYTDTTHVAAFIALPVFEDAGAGNIYAQVPVLLAADHTDGSRHNYAGCITVHKTNVPVGDAVMPDPDWYLRGADVDEVADFDLARLDTVCEDRLNNPQTPYMPRYSPAEVLGAYANAISNHDYVRAYNYWETPPDNATLQQFQAGYTDTAFATAVIRADAFLGVAAGSTYVSVPTLWTATDDEGNETFFGGCYTTRHSDVPVGDAAEPEHEWWLYSAQVQELEPAALQDPMALLDNACLLNAEG